MYYTLDLCSTKENDIKNFLNSFYNTDILKGWDYSIHTNNPRENIRIYLYKKRTTNPIDFVVLLGALADNSNKYNINTWLSLDNNIFINITPNNIDSIIKYIYERFPY